MAQFADLVGYDTRGQLTLVVEVKARTGRPRDWATQLRRNILEHGLMPKSPFYLIALPDRLFLWKDAGNAPELVDPTYEIDATPIFQPYFQNGHLEPEKLYRQTFEFIVLSWLNELTYRGVRDEVPEAQRRALEESGLLKAIKGGSVSLQVAE